MIQLFKTSKRTATKKKNVIISLLLVAALAITGALAYLTATDSAENKFTVGNVDISLTEPNWNESNGENIVAGQVITKDPTVTNTGTNDAYAYIMVEIPKVYSTGIVSTDAEGNTVTTSESHYPLFSFEANDGWTLIDSQIGTETDAYDYYLYAYDTALAPNGAATLFNEVTFANITEDFVNSITGEEIVDLAINVTGYAIQSDYYNNEATDAASAWTLYANQNNWAWPDKPYEGLVKVNYLNENDELVNTDVVYAGAPVTMYFEPSLAKTGYTFDWVDETTGETAYSGMIVESDTTLTASYAETGYENQVTTGLAYQIQYDETNGLYAALVRDDAHSNLYDANYEQYNGKTVVVPASIKIKLNGYEPTSPDAYVYMYNSQLTFTSAGIAYNSEFELPVRKVESLSLVFLDPETIILPDSVTMYGTHLCSNGIAGGNYVAKNLKTINMPYGATEVPQQAFQHCASLTTVVLPASIKTINKMAFNNCSALTNVEIPDSVTTIGENAFSGCTALVDIFIPDSVVDIGNQAFYNCSNLVTASVPSTCTFGTYTFPSTCKITYR